MGGLVESGWLGGVRAGGSAGGSAVAGGAGSGVAGGVGSVEVEGVWFGGVGLTRLAVLDTISTTVFPPLQRLPVPIPVKAASIPTSASHGAALGRLRITARPQPSSKVPTAATEVQMGSPFQRVTATNVAPNKANTIAMVLQRHRAMPSINTNEPSTASKAQVCTLQLLKSVTT